MINYSFVIPHHNCPNLLYRLIDSIPQREDIEIIVVDDNSDSDKKPKVLRKDIHIVYISAEESKGAGHARNVGLDLAKGKWVLFADSDDYYVKDFIRYLDYYVDSDNDIVIFSAYINYNPKEPDNCSEPNYIERTYFEYENSKKVEKDLRRLTMSINVPWNKMFKHDFINGINCRFESVPVGNDAWFCKYAGANAKNVVFIPKRLYYYIKYSDNTTHRTRPISDYYKIIKSNIKRNQLYQQYNLLEIAVFPGFYADNVIRDFGYFVYLKLTLYAIVHDPTIFNMLYCIIKSRVMKWFCK